MGIDSLKSNIKESRDKEFVKKVLGHFIDIKNNYSDELPNGRIETTDNENDTKFKCRTNIFGGVLSLINLLVDQGIIEKDEEVEKILEYGKKIKFHMTSDELIAFKKAKKENPEMKDPTFRTKDDIIFINEALDYMINLLSK